MHRRDVLKLGLGATALAGLPFGLSGPVRAADFPSRTMTMIVPYPAGGVADLRGRLIADWLEKDLGRSVITENIPGASGILGVKRVGSEPADGHTMISTTSSGAVVVPQLSKVDYVPLEILTPVAQVFINPVAVMVAHASPYKTIQDVVDDAKKRPGEITFASPGANSLYHLTGEAINTFVDIKLTHVPYKGAAQYTIDLLAGRVDIAIGTLGTVMSQKDKVRALIVGADDRSVVAPDVPSAPEAGLPDLVMPAGAGIFAHIDSPKENIKILSDSLERLSKDQTMMAKAASAGLEVKFLDSGAFKAALQKQSDLIARLIVEANLQVN